MPQSFATQYHTPHQCVIAAFYNCTIESISLELSIKSLSKRDGPMGLIILSCIFFLSLSMKSLLACRTLQHVLKFG